MTDKETNNTSYIFDILAKMDGELTVPILWNLSKSTLSYAEIENLFNGKQTKLLTNSLYALGKHHLIKKDPNLASPHLNQHSLSPVGQVITQAFVTLVDYGILTSND